VRDVAVNPNDLSSPHGFPVWVRSCHFFNVPFMMLLIGSCLAIFLFTSHRAIADTPAGITEERRRVLDVCPARGAFRDS
jgi:hypothetical protein